jgi:hypothetical protein
MLPLRPGRSARNVDDFFDANTAKNQLLFASVLEPIQK